MLSGTIFPVLLVGHEQNESLELPFVSEKVKHCSLQKGLLLRFSQVLARAFLRVTSWTAEQKPSAPCSGMVIEGQA